MTVNAFADPYKNTVVQASLPKTPTYSGTYRGYVLSGITLSSPVLLEVDYYDAYGFAGTSPFPAANNADFAYDSSIGSSFSAYYSPSAQGLQTGSLLKVLDNTAGNQYLWSVSYFDDKCRVVQHRASTHLGGVEKDWFLYDFTGNATKRKTEHKPSSGTSLIETATQTYNTWGHPVKTTHKLGSGTAQVVSNRTYDKAGRLATDKRNGTAALKTTFSYNIRSWVTGISGSLFTETLNYQDAPPVRWGGDVSKVSWTDGQSSNLKSYTLAYDTIGRLKTASFSDAGNASANFTEKVTQYDGNGNIKKLERYGRTGASTYGKIDDLVYTYSGNKATSIKDTGAAAYSSDFRFSNGTNNTYSYSYDAAGRITADASKGISSITWNVLGLPQTVTFSSGAVINYSYAADGTKLRESRTASSTTTTTDYTGNVVLENGTRSRLLFDGGYMSLSDNAYHYFLTDHLGSVRVVASASGTAEEYDHYYPLGGPIAKYSTATSIQPVKYQGKEWGASKGLDLYDFGARRYDPATGRWLSQDPLAEKYYAHSPYLFCAANPMRFVDPRGRSTQVRRLDDGRFEVIGGNLEDSDLGIYVGELDQDGAWKQTEKDAIGYSATLYSFYNTDEGENHGWQIGAIIDPHDNSGQRFMNRFGSYSNLLEYMLRARTNHSWDFKVTNGVSNNPIDGISIYRGMPITIGGNVVYASARDVGNIVAGYVGGINGLSWESFRFGCDTYQTFYSSLKKGSLSKEVEGMTTTTAQRLGWEKGNFSWGVLNALRK